MATAVQAAPGAGSSSLVLLTELIWQPYKLFFRFRQAWPWGPAYVITALLIGAGTLITHSSVLNTTVRVLQEQNASASAIQTGILMQKIGFVAAPIMSPFINPILLAYFLLFAGLLVGARARFGQWFCLAMWASVPSVGLRYVTQGLVHYGNTDVPVYAIDLTVATFLPTDIAPFLKAAAVQIDPYQLWTLALISVGVSAITHRPLRQGVILSGLILLVRFLFTVALL